MTTYRNILFCTDFSENARYAAPFAVDLARKYSAELHLLHVYQEPGDVAEFEISSNLKMDWIRVARLLGTEMEKKLSAACEEITGELGSCRPNLLRGKPHLEILRYAKEKSIDLIVMGSHGLTGLEHVLFGSTTERVLRESPCHVLVIRRP
ncbi:MAG TPA: universal stress protein, partial [Thermodesulfobacteriota bacterium]|nr:universal stress protein [Thermodesulfobacteriota bacterium]